MLVVVDTLRVDHLTSYGWPVPTSPEIEAGLARHGVVVERAYAQAPWTVPSMVSLMASRWPGEVMGPTVESYGIPAGSPSLAAALRSLGYETAAFVANPTLDRKVGFARGFSRYDSPTAELPWARADHITRMAQRWLAVRRTEAPFFLYVHYVDPHDPYQSPELIGGRSPFFPSYRGTVSGTWPQGLMLGKLHLPVPLDDVRQLAALYDSEIHSVDRRLGELLAGFDEATRARTLFVLTADHGEELYDHGGWKHGRTMYEEQLRVPLVLRWDGRLPAGSRVPGPVRLIDLAPTLFAAAGGAPLPGWQGVNLLPLLQGGGEPAGSPRPAVYAAHYLDGPRRAAAVLGRWKLALFDRAASVTPANDYEARLYRREMGRLPRLALFDLAADPRERRDVAASHPEVVVATGAVVLERMGREVPGLRVLLAGVEAGATVSAELRFSRPPRSWESCFLGPADRVRLDGDRLRLTLVGEALPKGILLPEGVEVSSVGLLGPAGIVVRLGGGATYRGGPVNAASTRREHWPPMRGPRLLLWQPVRPQAAAVDLDIEARERLRALGYAG